jgi:hypothetical protein
MANPFALGLRPDCQAGRSDDEDELLRDATFGIGWKTRLGNRDTTCPLSLPIKRAAAEAMNIALIMTVRLGGESDECRRGGVNRVGNGKVS